MLDVAGTQSQVLARQLQTEVGRNQTEAHRVREQDPQQALELLQATRQKVADAQISDDARSQLLRRLDVTIKETEKYFDEHRAEIELDQQNKAVLADVDRSREVKLKLQQKTAELVNDFNRLRDEQRYAEMEVVARRLYEMNPDEPVAQQVWMEAKFIRRTILNRQLNDLKEDSFVKQLYSTESSAVNPVSEDGHEVDFDKHYWNQFVKDRKGTGDLGRRNERELEIERRLQTPVRLRYQNTPLSQVVDELSQLAGINIHLDPRGLSQEGVETDTPVTINFPNEISLKSALQLILTQFHLSYVIKDEVLQITSEQISKGDLIKKVYNVADLVIPIPNFVPSSNSGLQGMINDAFTAEAGRQFGVGGGGPRVFVGERGNLPSVVGGASNKVLANQMPGVTPTTSGGLVPTTAPWAAAQVAWAAAPTPISIRSLN